MGFDRGNQRCSGTAEENTNNDGIGMNVVIEEADYDEAPSVSQVKQELSDLENIIMEGDIILKVHPDGQIEAVGDTSQKELQAMSGECADHTNLFLHTDEMLLKVGDKFQTHRDFVNYVNDNAKRWCFYYKCTEAHSADTENEEYTYSCVFLRNRDYKKKGAKKRYNCKTDCPCKVKLRRRPGEGLTVVHVCNHHDHVLTTEDFNKLQQNKKLPPYIKEIIMDLLSLDVEIAKIRKLVEIETGVKMSRAFFYDIERKMKTKNMERVITEKRLKELSEKINVIGEVYSGEEDDSDDQIQSTKSKRQKISADGVKKILQFDDDRDSVQNLEASISTDTHTTSWDNDQRVPRTSTTEWDESIDGSRVKTEQETDGNTIDDDYDNEYTADETAPSPETTQQTETTQNGPQYVFQDEFGNVINCGKDEQIVMVDENGMVQGENGAIGYFDGEQIIYMDPNEANERNSNDENDANDENDGNDENDANDSSNACDAAVQTSNMKPGHSFVPVFDVYMKDGNVTGFVVNDKVVKGAAEKSVQATQDSLQEAPEVSEIVAESSGGMSASNAAYEFVCGDTYTKHEYIHRYNIDHYMTNPKFPKYIDTLAKKTRTDVMQMLARVYNEKAMFKMTTTQRGKEGNTKIWYLTDVRRKGKYKMTEEEKMKRDKLGQYLTDVLILKERVKSLKKDNEELITRNKYLEEVVLRLAKMNESN